MLSTRPVKKISTELRRASSSPTDLPVDIRENLWFKLPQAQAISD
jgi:hypothetical protein